VCPDARPVKQKVWRQAQDRQDFIVKEVQKLEKAKVIWEVMHPRGRQTRGGPKAQWGHADVH
jgi:hypothetical protein